MRRPVEREGNYTYCGHGFLQEQKLHPFEKLRADIILKLAE